jgi:transcriptional regulator with XRE-family HTH domain
VTAIYDLADSGIGGDEWFSSTARTTAPTTLGGPRRYLACAAVAGCAITGTYGTITPADAIALSIAFASRPGTLSAVSVTSSAPPSIIPVAVPEVLQRLRRVSGLSWGEIAQAVGVSRRTIHNWLSGARLADVHLDRLLTLRQAVEKVEAGSGQATRDALLAPQASGRSILEDLVLVARPRRRSLMSGISVADQVTPVDEAASVALPRLSRRSSLQGGSLSRRRPD